jgi:hypothetical protein
MRTAARAALLITLVLLAAASEAQSTAALSQEVGVYRVTATPESGWSTTVTIRERAGDVRTVIAEIGQPRDVRLVSESRLVLNGEAGVAVVDPRDGRLIDQFVHRTAALSPSGSRIAFLPLSPQWRDESALYLVYDVRRTPDENRMLPNLESGPSRGPFDLRQWVSGIAVYPPENVRERTYARIAWVNPPGGMPSEKTDDFGSNHELRSRLTWLDDVTLAFVDIDDSDDAYLVLLDLSDASPRVSKQAINVAPLVSPTAIRGDENTEFIESFRRQPVRYLGIDGILPLPASGDGRRLRLTWRPSAWWTQTSLDVVIN